MKFSLSSFSGIRPATDARLLPDDTAQIAHNCTLKSGKIVPLNKDSHVKDCASTTKAVFKQAGEFIQVDFPADFATSPVNADQYDRVYFTGHPDGALRMCGKFSGSAYSTRRVYVPKPSSAPTVSASSGYSFPADKITFKTDEGFGNLVTLTPEEQTTVQENAEYSVTFEISETYYDGFDYTWNNLSPGTGLLTIGETQLTITGGEGSVTANGVTITVSKISITQHDPSAASRYHKWTSPACTVKLKIAISRSLGLETWRSYCYTLVDDIGQEGPPSDVSALVQTFEDYIVKVTCSPNLKASSGSSGSSSSIVFDPSKPGSIGVIGASSPSSGSSSGTVAEGFDGTLKKIRLYRTAGTETDADFFFVAEVDYAAEVTFTDATTNSALAERLILGANPPANLSGLVKCPNGSLAAFVGRDLYFSEPYLPNKWPAKYNFVTENPIVGLASVGSAIIALTEAEPEIFTGSAPESMMQYKTSVKQSCSSKSSICTAAGRVFYASPDGLASITPEGATAVVSQNHFTRDQWQALHPESMLAASHDDKVYIFAGELILIADLSSDLEFTTADADSDSPAVPGEWDTGTAKALCLYENTRDDTLYILLQGGSLRAFAGSSEKRVAAYRTKLIELPYARDFSVARVVFDAYSKSSAFKLTSATGSFSHTLTRPTSFRLPFMRRERTWFVDLANNAKISSLELADSTSELKSGQ